MVHQELALFPDLTVLANLFIGNEIVRGGRMDMRAMELAARPWMDRLDLRFPSDTPVGTLSIGERQLVEICRALIQRPQILILDEPNSALSEGETNRLFGILEILRDEGLTLLYISHRLKEVLRISDVVTVMRNGKVVRTDPVMALDVPILVEAMLGRKQGDHYPSRAGRAPSKGKSLEIRNVSVCGRLNDVSLTARPGEVIGFAGLEGSGIQTLFGIVFGNRTPNSGAITYPDGAPGPRTVNDAVRRGACLVPSDRRKLGLMMERTFIDNVRQICIGVLPEAPFFPGIARARRDAERMRRLLQIKLSSIEQRPAQLSGGNQQKVVLAKWLVVDPTLFILDDPTRGIDIGAKREIFDLIDTIARDGGIVLFHSTEMSELAGVADRVLVFYGGRIVGEVRGAQIDEEALLHYINTGDLHHAV